VRPPDDIEIETDTWEPPNRDAEAMEVDDDNKPIEDNMDPTGDKDVTVVFASAWSHTGTCERQSQAPADMQPKLLHFEEKDINNEKDVFEHLLPMRFVEEVM
jgi:hypothetical protein